MLRLSLLLVFAVFLDIVWNLSGGHWFTTQLTLMAIVARTMREFDYPTVFLALGLGCLFDAWHLGIFGGQAAAWLIVLLLVTRLTRLLYPGQLSTHLLVGFCASAASRFVQFVLWSSMYRTGTPLTAVTGGLIAGAVADAVALAALYRAAYGSASGRSGLFTEARL